VGTSLCEGGLWAKPACRNALVREGTFSSLGDELDGGKQRLLDSVGEDSYGWGAGTNPTIAKTVEGGGGKF